MKKQIPLLFACSGCSNAGQITNQMALELDRRGLAEMSCLAGIGAGKAHFLEKLTDREVWIIDGCPIECCLGVFAQIRQHVDVHIRLYDLGVRKNSPLPADQELEQFVADILQYVSRQKAGARQGCTHGPHT